MNKGLSIKNNIKLTSSVRVLAIFFVPFLMLLWQKGAADDIRIINAQIITMDESNPTASSLLISGNRIIDIDSNEFQESNNSFVGTLIDGANAGNIYFLPLLVPAYNPNHAAPAPTTIDTKPDCSKVGVDKFINHIVTLYSRNI